VGIFEGKTTDIGGAIYTEITHINAHHDAREND
jgi:hypothetical protein